MCTTQVLSFFVWTSIQPELTRSLSSRFSYVSYVATDSLPRRLVPRAREEDHLRRCRSGTSTANPSHALFSVCMWALQSLRCVDRIVLYRVESCFLCINCCCGSIIRSCAVISANYATSICRTMSTPTRPSARRTRTPWASSSGDRVTTQCIPHASPPLYHQPLVAIVCIAILFLYFTRILIVF